MALPGATLRRLPDRLLVPPARSDATELLDGNIDDPAELAANFRDIQRVNRLLGGTATVLRHLPSLLDAVPGDRTATILDLATGAADIPLAIARRAERDGRPVRIVASDASDAILDLARANVAGHPAIETARLDARAVDLPDDAVDIAICSLSLHHFPPVEAIRVLREMHRVARTGLILNDLRRSRAGWVAALVAARLTTRNRLTRNDAPLSVLRAYTPAELAGLLDRAGIENATFTTHPWFRMAAVARRERPDA
jgi:ubiquinone/menaquinone biosynthesis C-methylase UbiE